MANMMFCKVAKASIILILGLGMSCNSYLDVGAPKSEIESDVVFGNDVTATSAMLGVYSQLLDPGSFVSGTPSSVMALTGLSSDELVNFSRDQNMVEFEDNSINSSNSYIFLLWSSLYKTVYQVNAIIEGVDGSNGLSDRVRDQLKGEAFFLRAFCYFHLVNIYGDVPLVLSTDYRANASIPRTAVTVLYDHILSDLNLARTLLVDRYPAVNGERVRPNKLVATAFLARVYLYLEDWRNAEVMASEVISHNELYSMVDSVSDIFLMNSSESIWQLRPVINDDRGYTYEALYFSPANVLNYNVIRSVVVKEFELDDQRLKHWIEYVIVEPDTVYFPRKYKQDQFSEYLTEYSSVLRLAEQYLIRSEARAMQGNVLGDNSAESDVNVIRNRAGIDSVNATTQDDMLNSIVKERRLEFIAEGGHRWFDLKRWGIAKNALIVDKYKFDSTDELYPLPAIEFRNNRLLEKQNDGY